MTPKRHIIPVFVPHLGCPNDCVFCNQRKISGALEPATAESTKAEVEGALGFIPQGADIQLAFYGGSFTAIPVREQNELLSVGADYIKRGKIKSMRLSTRPDCIDIGCAERLLEYGVKTVELGVQSLDDEVLCISGRGHTAKDAVFAADAVKRAGLELILQMMTGLPGDTKEKSIETAEKIAALRPDGVRIYPTVIVRGTALYEMWKAGEYMEHTVSEAADWCCDICEIFERENIPVIRLGLNPTDDLSGGEAAGGAYHPAFGQIVKSRRYLKAAERIIFEKYGENVPSSLEFQVCRGDTSAFIGQKRANMHILREKYGVNEIKVSETCEKPETHLYLSLK